jgi:CRISPR-associated protein (TIGR03984 family)
MDQSADRGSIMSEHFLHGRTSRDILLTEALASCAVPLTGAIALLYSPEICCFARLEDSVLVAAAGEIDVSSVFEARVFNEACELRWLNERNGRGRAVLLSEAPQTCLDEGIAPLKFLETLRETYLLWGEQIDSDPATGWSRVGRSRMGAIAVPVAPLPKGACVYLQVREYLGEIGNHGNVTVIEERLIGLTDLEAEERHG